MTCITPSCPAPAHPGLKGMCCRHYWRVRRNGTTDAKDYPSRKPLPLPFDAVLHPEININQFMEQSGL